MCYQQADRTAAQINPSFHPSVHMWRLREGVMDRVSGRGWVESRQGRGLARSEMQQADTVVCCVGLTA